MLPFILRGVKLLGIDSVMCPMAKRLEVWRRLATDIGLDELRTAFATLLAGGARGRYVVNL